jgi:hypothetical protein
MSRCRDGDSRNAARLARMQGERFHLDIVSFSRSHEFQKYV